MTQAINQNANQNINTPNLNTSNLNHSNINQGDRVDENFDESWVGDDWVEPQPVTPPVEIEAAWDRQYPDLVKAYSWEQYFIYWCEQWREDACVDRLIIERQDRDPVGNWADFQTMKTLILGDDRIAVQIFPPDEAIVDQVNVYHLWSPRDGEAIAFEYQMLCC